MLTGEFADQQKCDLTVVGKYPTILFPSASDFVQAPTVPGRIRKLLQFKLDQYNYLRKKGVTLSSYLKSQVIHDLKAEVYDQWIKRGISDANDSGILLPDKFKEGGLSEIFGDRVYEVEGFIPSKGDRVLDIGSQYGDFSIACSKLYGVKEVHAFEPIGENVQIIREMCDLNNIHNVVIHNTGLSDSSHEETFSFRDNMLCAETEGDKVQEFNFETLDSYQLGCDLVKIDVEGYELKVLKGGMQTIVENKPRIIMEVHSRRLKKNALDVLGRIGYKKAKGEKMAFLNGFIENVFLEPNS